MPILPNWIEKIGRRDFCCTFISMGFSGQEIFDTNLHLKFSFDKISQQNHFEDIAQ